MRRTYKHKRIISLILSAVLIFGMIPTAFATESAPAETTAETTSPVETTIPVVETTSAAEETTSAAEETTSAAEETTSAAEETTSAAEETTSAAEETTSAAEETTSAAEETTVPETTEDVEETTVPETTVPEEDTYIPPVNNNFSGVDYTNPAPLLPPVVGTNIFSPMMLFSSGRASDNESGSIVLDKTVRYNDDGTFTLNLEAYATGAASTVTQVPIPTDVVLVLDESGSMNDCIACGHEMTDKCDKLESEMKDGKPVATYGHAVMAEGVNTAKTYKVFYSDASQRTLSWCTTCKAWFSDSRHETHKPAGGSLYSWTPFEKSSDKADFDRNDGDGYHVQFYCNCGASHTTQRVDALRNACNAFLDEMATNSKGKDNELGTPDDIDNRVAIVGYGDDTGYRIYSVDGNAAAGNKTNAAKAFKQMTNTADINTLRTGIKNIKSSQATATNRGMEGANAILDNNKVAAGEERNRVVILFTDGSPGSGYVNNTGWANGAISYSNTIKNTHKATVYCVGLFWGADASNPASLPAYDENANGVNNLGFFKNGNRFLHLVSSNYPKAKSLTDTGAVASLAAGEGYYLSTDNEEGLYEIFGKLANVVKPGSTTVTLDEETVVKDIVASSFDIPEGTTSVTAWTESFKGNNTWQKDSSSVSNVTSGPLKVNVDDNTVTVKNFDFAENYVATDKDANNNDVPRGKKLVFEILIKPAESFGGGNHIATNTSDAGIYDSTGEKVESFPVPHVDVGTKVTVKKQVVGANAEFDKEFDFDVTYNKITAYKNIDPDNTNSGVENSNFLDAETTEQKPEAQLHHDESVTYSNVLIGEDQYILVKEENYPAYTTTVTAKDSKGNITVGAADANGYYKIPVNNPNVEITVTNTIKSADLKIVKKVARRNDLNKDPDTTFLFHLKGTDTGTNTVDMILAINDNGTTTTVGQLDIKSLPVGNYTLTELEDWSWRYEVSDITSEKVTVSSTNFANGEIKFTLDYNGGTITFTNDREQDKWLDGDTYCENTFNKK